MRVQCANWLDVNRVQVFVNGRPDAKLNFTRRTTPERFKDGVVKFAAKLPLELKEDSHIIVATIGEGLELGRIFGPQLRKQPPLAVANPIFVEDAARSFCKGLKADARIGDFRVLASHQESLHSHDAVSLLTEGATFAQESLDPRLFQSLVHAG